MRRILFNMTVVEEVMVASPPELARRMPRPSRGQGRCSTAMASGRLQTPIPSRSRRASKAILGLACADAALESWSPSSTSRFLARDPHGREVLDLFLDTMLGKGKSVMMILARPRLIDDVASRTLVLEDGRIAFDGPTGRAWASSARSAARLGGSLPGRTGGRPVSRIHDLNFFSRYACAFFVMTLAWLAPAWIYGVSLALASVLFLRLTPPKVFRAYLKGGDPARSSWWRAGPSTCSSRGEVAAIGASHRRRHGRAAGDHHCRLLFRHGIQFARLHPCRLQRPAPPPLATLVLSLTFGLIPMLREDFERIADAQRARHGNRRRSAADPAALRSGARRAAACPGGAHCPRHLALAVDLWFRHEAKAHHLARGRPAR